LRYTEFVRIQKIKKTLDLIAYGSLAIDIGIAMVTFASLQIYSKQLNEIQFFLNAAVSGEVIITLFLFGVMMLLYRYERITDNLARFSRILTGKKDDRPWRPRLHDW
jgi:hypothetical protein